MLDGGFREMANAHEKGRIVCRETLTALIRPNSTNDDTFVLSGARVLVHLLICRAKYTAQHEVLVRCAAEHEVWAKYTAKHEVMAQCAARSRLV